MLAGLLKRLGIGGGLPASSGSWPEPLRAYMSLRHRPAKRTTLSEVRFVVFDTETTGLDVATNRILSIAGVGMLGTEVRLGDVFETMVAQSQVGGAEAAVVHGLVSSDVVDGLAEDQAVAEFLAFAGDAVLVAHHAAFDIGMLHKAIATHRGAKVWNPVVDTAQLAMRVDGEALPAAHAQGADERRAYQLDGLLDRYGIEISERHTAAGDALATALLLQRLLKKADSRGIKTLGDLLAR